MFIIYIYVHTNGGIMTIPKDARITLDPEEIPKRWYNLAADLPEPIAPPLNPVT